MVEVPLQEVQRTLHYEKFEAFVTYMVISGMERKDCYKNKSQVTKFLSLYLHFFTLQTTIQSLENENFQNKLSVHTYFWKVVQLTKLNCNSNLFFHIWSTAEATF